MIAERISKLRMFMKESDIDAYIITTSDYHSSEYIGEYFKERQYMSGFTGSAGTMVVLADKAALWTDGRYFLQAAEELAGSGIELMKSGMEGVPDIKSYLISNLSEGMTIGFDGRKVTAAFAYGLKNAVKKENILINGNVNLIEKIWKNRPEISCNPVWELEEKYSGMDRIKKLEIVRQKMKEEEAEVFVLTSLDDIAWLLNLRGNDVEYTMVFLSYMIIFADKAYLYADKRAFNSEIKNSLLKAKVEIRDYNSVYENLRALVPGNIMLDKSRVNYAIINSIDKEKNIIDRQDITTELKAVKTKTEMENIAKAHIKDGVAVTKFMYWLKENVGTENITELSAAEKMEEYRRLQEGYICPSFAPIVAYGANAAMCHYSANEESNASVKQEGFLLADTGGQYYEGTTDITRTFVTGKLTEEQKKMYTLVLAGHLKLAAAKFPYGVRGINLDILAREPLWRNGIDYNHGTGHGVGYLLNVHEGPNNIRWKVTGNNVSSAVFEEGMVTSDEPGVYIDGEYGIRLENLILCKKAEKTEFAQFMCFDMLTMVPFDKEAIDKKYLNKDEIKLLNKYHKQVYDNISPYFEGNELEWLKEATAEI